MQINEELLDIEGIQKSNKPLIDLFIRRTAVLTSTPEYIVEKIIKDQWRNANKQTAPGLSISEIDFSNLGVFYLSSSKGMKRIQRQEKFQARRQSENPLTDIKAEKKRLRDITETEGILKSIKTKLKQIQ